MSRRDPLRAAVVLAIVLGAPVLFREPPVLAETAREILDRARQLDDTAHKWTDRARSMTLHIVDKSGDRERTLKMYDKRDPTGDDKTVCFFLSPAEVKGTAFLQWAHAGHDAEQWLYVPDVKRTRRVTSNVRDQSFMGTDFSYRDLEILNGIQRWTEDDAPAKLTGSEDVDGRPCHVIELTPKQEGMKYSRIVIALDKETLVLRKMDFHDETGTLAKTLLLSDVHDIGAVPTAHRLEMRTPAKGSKTEVQLSDVAYDKGLPDDLFTERQLARGAP